MINLGAPLPGASGVRHLELLHDSTGRFSGAQGGFNHVWRFVIGVL